MLLFLDFLSVQKFTFTIYILTRILRRDVRPERCISINIYILYSVQSSTVTNVEFCLNNIILQRTKTTAADWFVRE